MFSQLSMFTDESARPEGLHYQPDLISAQEEAALIGNIHALPLAPFQFGIYEGKRRVVIVSRADEVGRIAALPRVSFAASAHDRLWHGAADSECPLFGR